MIIVLAAQVANTPAGSPFTPDTPSSAMPVAPEVVWMKGVNAVFTQSVGVVDGADTEQATVIVLVQVTAAAAGEHPDGLLSLMLVKVTVYVPAFAKVILPVVSPVPLVVLTPVVGVMAHVLTLPPPVAVLVAVPPVVMDVAASQVNAGVVVHGVEQTVSGMVEDVLSAPTKLPASITMAPLAPALLIPICTLAVVAVAVNVRSTVCQSSPAIVPVEVWAVATPLTIILS